MTEPTRRRGTKGERTRSRILDSAMELFSRSGFHAVSLRDIAAHAGLTHAGLLHHFPGKDALLIEVLKRREVLTAEIVSAYDSSAEPAEVIRRHVDQLARNMRTPGLVGLFVKVSAEATAPGHPAHTYFVERYRRLRKGTARVLGELFAQATPPLKHDPDAVAGQLIAVVDGLQTQWLLDPDRVDMHASVLAFLTELGLDIR
ncbi:TetR/AcrR family transcriptional regulator [Nonomuraea sp. SBT364]|uniref:TetR/AcrR family transcriptional regulator n=1 Tax=Nonomuraea sp. SBT364 TaxID=1580530 RepID=UPI00066E0B79|nr:TetR/AcrR family transcriptional regulator [Nonomuraea sp. SBT364]